METTEPLVRMALHMMIRVHKFKLSKENKNKAEKHRIQVRQDCVYLTELLKSSQNDMNFSVVVSRWRVTITHSKMLRHLSL